MFSMMMLLILTTMMFIFIKNPLSMGIALMIQVILISLISGLMSQNFWFSYILFLIVVGGLLIMFIYMTSVASTGLAKTRVFLEKPSPPGFSGYFWVFLGISGDFQNATKKIRLYYQKMTGPKDSEKS